MDEKIFEKQYKQLNPKQKEAVDTIDGPVMVIAGPGTGKTTILSLRIANILKKTDAQPENILALTFTNAGVYAMRNKLLEVIGDSAYRVNIFTFHSFCENVIKEFPSYFDNFENKQVIDDLERVKLFEEIIKENKFKEIISFHDEFSSLSKITKAIDDIKKEGLTPVDFSGLIPGWEKDLLSNEDNFYKRKYGKFNAGDLKPSAEKTISKKIANTKEIAEVFEIYQEKLEEKRLYDFHDMVLLVIKKLNENDELKFDLQEKLQYLLVDEHQDTNDGQNKIIELLTDSDHLDGKANIFTVGDEKQSIYRFQGASEKTFQHLHEIYKDINTISLNQNYRSTNNILNSSYALIKNNDEGLDSIQLESNLSENELINVAEFSNYKFELLYLAEDIKTKISSGVDPNEISIMYRSNKHIDDIKNILSLKNINYTVSSKDNILNDYEINNLIHLLKIVNNHNNEESLGRALMVNFLEFDSYDVLKVFNKSRKFKREKGLKLFGILENEELLKEIDVKNVEKFTEFVKKIKKLKTLSENSNFLSFFKNFLDEIGYVDYLINSNNSINEIIKLDKIFDEIKRQEQKIKNYSLPQFVDFIDSYIKYNLQIKSSDPEVLDGVKLMTAHGSKGLEFEYVYIINSARKNWEKKRAPGFYDLPIKSYKGTLEDERRLFYVAMTRAKKGLFISSSKTDWEGKEQDKTQFINEIDSKFINEIQIEGFEKDSIKDLILFIKNSNSNKSIWNKEYLKNIFLEKGWNVTALNNYVSCPIKYLFRNLIQLPSDYPSHLIFGTLIHKTLEQFFTESKKQKNILDKKYLLKFFNENIKNSNLNEREYEKYLEKGLNVLNDYYDQYNKEWFFNVDTEQKIKKQFQLESGDKIRLSGDVDKIEYLDSEIEGKINLIDYKTGKTYSEKTKDEKSALDRQIVFYHLLLDGYKNNNYYINKAILDFIEIKKKTDLFEPRELHVEEEQINKLKDLINEVSNEIISGEFINNGCQKKDCEYCNLKKNL